MGRIRDRENRMDFLLAVRSIVGYDLDKLEPINLNPSP